MASSCESPLIQFTIESFMNHKVIVIQWMHFKTNFTIFITCFGVRLIIQKSKRKCSLNDKKLNEYQIDADEKLPTKTRVCFDKAEKVMSFGCQNMTMPLDVKTNDLCLCDLLTSMHFDGFFHISTLSNGGVFDISSL